MLGSQEEVNQIINLSLVYVLAIICRVRYASDDDGAFPVCPASSHAPIASSQNTDPGQRGIYSGITPVPLSPPTPCDLFPGTCAGGNAR